MRRRTAKRLGIAAFCVAAVIVALIFIWSWDWFIPVVDSYASAALGRPVTIRHLHVRLGRVTHVAADDVEIANPDGFPGSRKFATIKTLGIDADIWAYLRHQQIVLPAITLDTPDIDAIQKANGDANWNLTSNGKNTSSSSKSSSPGPQIGDLRIHDGHVHVVDAKVKADFNLDVHTTEGGRDGHGEIVVGAKGTYAKQPITGEFKGGSLLSLRNTADPYPVDLHLANGPTKVSLVGTITDPAKLQGFRLKLEFSGPDMALLFPLTGVPIPETPAYNIAGNLDYAEHKFKFRHFTGKVGSSDLNGEIDVDPTGAKPVVDADLTSRNVDLADLGGFIGETPGRKGSTPQSPAQKHELAQKESSGRLLPTTPINMPKVEAANVHLHYKGEHIEGRNIPFDNIVVALDIDNGRIRLHPLSFAVGSGHIIANVDLTPEAHTIHAKANVDFSRLDLSRIMDATHVFHGQGIIGGKLDLDTTGNSMSSFLGNGNGGVKLFLQSGGDLSALLTDLVGLQLGDAVLSALGVPSRANLECFISDLPLHEGLLQTRVFLLNTSETQITGTGDVNFKNEQIDFTLKTAAKHFTIGSLPTPIDIRGTLKSPSVMPEVAPLAIRGGLAVALGVVGGPLGLLPTIQLGVGENGACANAARTLESGPGPHTQAAPHIGGH